MAGAADASASAPRSSTTAVTRAKTPRTRASPMAARPDDSASSARDEVFRRFDVRTGHRPAYVVWELTLACDQPCTHCGSRAGVARPNELTTAQALAVVDELAAMKTFEVALIGGEAYLHPGFLELIRALREKGIRPTMTTGGRSITPELAANMHQAGLHSVSVSLDGLEVTHDLMRASKGSFAAATAALKAFRDDPRPPTPRELVKKVRP